MDEEVQCLIAGAGAAVVLRVTAVNLLDRLPVIGETPFEDEETRASRPSSSRRNHSSRFLPCDWISRFSHRRGMTRSRVRIRVRIRPPEDRHFSGALLLEPAALAGRGRAEGVDAIRGGQTIGVVTNVQMQERCGRHPPFELPGLHAADA